MSALKTPNYLNSLCRSSFLCHVMVSGFLYAFACPLLSAMAYPTPGVITSSLPPVMVLGILIDSFGSN